MGPSSNQVCVKLLYLKAITTQCLSWILHSHTASKLSPFLFAACVLCPLLILTLCLWKLFLIDSCSIHQLHSLSFQCFQCQSGSGLHASACYKPTYGSLYLLVREHIHFLPCSCPIGIIFLDPGAKVGFLHQREGVSRERVPKAI